MSTTSSERAEAVGQPDATESARSATTAPGSRPRRRVPEWLVAVSVGLVGALVYWVPYLQRPYFYFIGDNPESFVPLWHHFGEQLLDGQWLTMDPDGWYGGNYAAEAAYALWNPVTLANYVLVAQFSDLALAAAVVMVEFLAILSVGVYLLAREYGAHRVPAAVVGIALPVSGFTLYYEASGWPAGLMAFTWVIWFWWAARRHARGHLAPVVPFLLGVLAMTTGNPYAPLGLVIVLAGIAVELLRRRSYRSLAHLVVMGACVGAAAALVFLPLLGATEVSSRRELAAVLNNTFMVPDLGDLAASGAPSYLPSITNWGDSPLERVPSTYFMWFALPLLAWVRWDALRRPIRPLTSLTVITAVYAVLVLGPSNLWLFRWPIRLIEYLYAGLAVFLAVVLSRGLARDRVRARVLATVGIVIGGGYLAWAVQPDLLRTHLVATGAVLALTLGAVALWHRVGWGALAAVLVLGTAATVFFQSGRLPILPPPEDRVDPPRAVSRLVDGTEDLQGTVLQLARQADVRTEDQDDGELLFGNMALAADLVSVNRYSGIGFLEFTNTLCMDYRGGACADAFDALWEPVEGTDAPLVDAMRVDTLVLQNSLLRREVDRQPPAGWRELLQDDVRTVWVREEPIDLPGRVSATADGVQVLSGESAPHFERLQVDGDGGRVVFARLAWPGYTATVDGEPVEVVDGDAGLLAVDVPAGPHEVTVSYEAPGVRIGAMALAGAALLVLLQSVLWWRGRRRLDDAWQDRTPDQEPDRTGDQEPDRPAPEATARS